MIGGPDDADGSSPRRPRWLRAAAWAALVVAAVAIRLPHLTESLWYDEVWRTRVVLRPGNLESLLLHDVHNPLYNAFMYAWISVIGDSEFSIRLPSLLFGLASITVLYRWMHARFGPGPARLAAALLLVSPVHAWYSCEAKNNMLVMLLGILAVVQTDALLTKGRWTDAFGAAIWSALGLLTSWQAGLVVIPAWIGGAVALLSADRSTPQSRAAAARRLKLLGGSILIALVMLSPLLIFKAEHVDELSRWYLAAPDLARIAELLFIWYPTGNALVLIRAAKWLLWIGIYGAVVGPALVLGCLALRRSATGRLVLACLWTPIVGLLLAWAAYAAAGETGPHVYQDRNMLVVFPWFICAIALGATQAGVLRPPLAGVLVALGLASSLAAVTWRADKSTVMNPNPDWRSAAAFIRESASTGDPPIIASCCPLLPLEYYSTPGKLVELNWQHDTFRDVQNLRRQRPGAPVFFINNPFWFGYPPHAIHLLEAGLGHPTRSDFLGLQVYRFAPLNAAHQGPLER
ncbi:MAG: hypothetical protein GIKADHBN_00953 [Phycisphaerales bacterium]|nr:hypothetical protein [Phycisphaerales bacterium]